MASKDITVRKHPLQKVSRLPVLPASRRRTLIWMPEIDIEDASGEYVLSAAVPGLQRQDLKVRVWARGVTITGERRYRSERGGLRRRAEQAYGRFERTLRLPLELKPEGAKAEYKDGLLKVRLPKAQESKTKVVRID